MAERRGALAELPAGAADAARVSLREIMPGSILQIQAWPDSLPAVQSVVSDLLGVTVPPMGSTAGGDGQPLVAAIAPGRFLVRADATDLPERFAAALTAEDGAVTDLTHGRTVLRLEGDGAATVLGKCVALDLDLAAFPPGRVAQTAIHHIDVVLHRRSESSFDLWALRSFAESLAEWLLDAGGPIGPSSSSAY
jgi:methylglutamate dehydrogenase subunit D